MTSRAPIMPSQKIGPSSFASRVRFCTGADESSDSMLPTTGLVGGCGIGLSLFFGAIVEFPIVSSFPGARSASPESITTDLCLLARVRRSRQTITACGYGFRAQPFGLTRNDEH